jgi:hypothetical protein
MILHAVFFTPGRLAAATLLEMAALRVDNAGVALSEFLKARVTVSLIEAFVGFSVAVNTVNATAENKLQLLID